MIYQAYIETLQPARIKERKKSYAEIVKEKIS